jgi:hypothetical protein
MTSHFYLHTLSRYGVLTMSTAGHYPTDVSEAQGDVLQLVLPPRVST